MNTTLPPLMVFDPTPPPLPTVRARARSRPGRVLALVWKWVFGAFLCQGVLGSVAAVGWTWRFAARVVRRAWLRQAGAAELGEAAGPGLFPNWIVHEDWPAERARLGALGRWPRLGGTLCLGVHSLWLNFRAGLPAILNTWVLTLPGCVLWLFAWYDGWNNSFNKGYEQAMVGPLTGVAGTLLFIAAMMYVPLAQVRQASTGDWRSFYQFPLVWGLVRRNWLGCVLLAALYSLFSVPAMVLKTIPMGLMNVQPEIIEFTPAEAMAYLGRFYFRAALLVFPCYVVLRWVAARIYARAMLDAVRAGAVSAVELGVEEAEFLREHRLLQPAPPPVRSWLQRALLSTGTAVWRMAAIGLAGFLWFTFVAQIFASEFFNYHPGVGWLNQPMAQLPWFRYLPPALQANPFGELILAGLVLGLGAMAVAMRAAGRGRSRVGG